MQRKKSFSQFLLIASFLTIPFTGFSQRYLTDVDPSLFIEDTVRALVNRLQNIHFSGYLQAQYQHISTNGAESYGGGDFSPDSRSRFMLRRARLRVDYLSLTEEKLPRALFVFQIDATERSVRVRDMFLRLYETKKNNFLLTTGIFARPFGFEVNLSSSFRETPERGRMSQILLPSERDLGLMVSYEPRGDGRSKYLKADLGIFNGPGLSAVTDFDNIKDIIGRITLNPFATGDGKFIFSGSVFGLHGGWKQVSKYVYEMDRMSSGDKSFRVDSSLTNVGKRAPKQYYGADAQLKWVHKKDLATEIRAEYWTGKQSGTDATTENPGNLPTAPTFIRRFNGAYFYFLQDVVSHKNQLIVKYDWYDPNIKASGLEIGKPGTVFGTGDLKYSTLGVGFIRRITNTVKLVLYYEWIKNESTLLAGYDKDLKDNLLTCRLQFRFP